MIQFLKNNWLALIGALAWLPVVFKMVINFFRKIHCVYLDKHFVYNVQSVRCVNNKVETKNGMTFILALNLFVYQKAFFPRKIECILKLKEGAKHKGILHEGVIAYSDTEVPTGYHKFFFPNHMNMNQQRVIFADKDNIRILPFFFENLNMTNDENIQQIELIFYGRLLKKKVKLKNTDCTSVNFIHQYDKKVDKTELTQ